MRSRHSRNQRVRQFGPVLGPQARVCAAATSWMAPADASAPWGERPSAGDGAELQALQQSLDRLWRDPAPEAAQDRWSARLSLAVGGGVSVLLWGGLAALTVMYR